MLPAMANAATLSFSPSSGSYEPGDTFSVSVYANPSAGEEITVAKLSASFPASMLEVVSFTQTTGWIPLATPGSDLIDNATGSLIKTAGFPARVTAQKQFGTITFKTKSVGTATVSIAGDSMLIDITNINKYVASTGANFTITAPAPAPATPSPVSVEATGAVTTYEVGVVDTDEATTAEEVATTTTAIDGQTAAVSIAGEGFFTVKTIVISLIVLILLALGLFLRKKKLI